MRPFNDRTQPLPPMSEASHGGSGAFRSAVTFLLQCISLPIWRITAMLWVTFPQLASADIYEWEWINPADHSQGRQQSTTLVPDGAGRDAVPGASFYSDNLTKAWLHGADLNNSSIAFSILSNADLSEANLTDASFYDSTLSGAYFTDAFIQGASFESTSGFTAAQLYSTGSYQAGDLERVNLSNIFLANWNFAGQNLSNAYFFNSQLTNANFTNAVVRGAHFGSSNSGGLTSLQLYSTASYQSGELSDIKLPGRNLSGWNFGAKNLSMARFSSAILNGTDFSNSNLSQADFFKANLSNANFSNSNLADADLYDSTLTNANLNGATIAGARFTASSGITAAQFYSTASYQTGDLSGVHLGYLNLTGWNFAGKDMTGAIFGWSTLTGANFNGTQVRGAWLSQTTSSGFTAAMLYATASYQAGDLGAIRLEYNNLSAWNFAQQNLEGAHFDSATCIGADFSDANLTGTVFDASNLTNAVFTNSQIRGASFSHASGFTSGQLYSTASYQEGDLTGISLRYRDLTNWSFQGLNLVDADLTHASLAGADFDGSIIKGINLTGVTDSGFTANQLHSTASYQSRNLSGIVFSSNDLSSWNFAHQNLSGASFDSDSEGSPPTVLTGTDFSHANLASARFLNSIRTGTIFTGSDTRGSEHLPLAPNTPQTENTIHADGTLYGLTIGDAESMRIWDYDSDSPLPITVAGALQIDPAGTLRIVFEDEHWGSTFTFQPGVSVDLDGTLELFIEPDEESTLTEFIGATFRLFDWTGVTPTGTFDVTSPYTWDLADLYTTGEVTLLAIAGLPGDFNGDGSVDAADYVRWRKDPGSHGGQQGIEIWRDHFGQTAGGGSATNDTVPEPASALLLMLCAAGGALSSRMLLASALARERQACRDSSFTSRRADNSAHPWA
jgi:uncharacterized protein YjbI with pentapeptide repeats